MMRGVFGFVMVVSLAAAASAGFLLQAPAAQRGRERVYELRTYTVAPGRMPAMLKRFRDHTTRLFEKQGMENIGYWTPEGKEADTKLIYVLAHNSREAADKSWKAFREDPDWQKVRDASEKDGKIVEKVESVFMRPTDFSKLK
jgi:hypothetical protein